MSDSIAEQVFTIKEAAAFLKISRGKLYMLVADDKLKICKLGSRSLIKGKELLRFIATL